MGTISERLQEALDRRHWDIQTLKNRVSDLSDEAEGTVRGVGYSSVYGYVKGDIPDPPLSFLKVAAKALGVQRAWLAFGDGDRSEAVAAVQDTLDSLSQDAALQLAPLSEDPEMVIDAFHGAFRRLVMAVETPPTPEQVTRLSELLVQLVKKPYWQLRHNLPGGPRQTEDYYVAALHALTLIMPMFASVDSIDTIISQMEG